MSESIWVDPTDRLHEEALLRQLVRPGDLVIDVGANIGTISLAVADAVGPAGRVVAIEPHPRAYAIMQRNLRLNNVTNVGCLNLALGDSFGSARISNNKSDDQNHVTSTEGIPVQIVRLDSLIREPVALVKIDVEGFEFEVLRGLEGIVDDIEMIQFEYHEEALAAYSRTGSELCDLVRSFGFEIYWERDGIWRPVRGHLTTSKCINLLAARDIALPRLGGLGEAVGSDAQSSTRVPDESISGL